MLLYFVFVYREIHWNILAESIHNCDEYYINEKRELKYIVGNNYSNVHLSNVFLFSRKYFLMNSIFFLSIKNMIIKY